MNPFYFKEPPSIEEKYELLQTIHMALNFYLLQDKEEKRLNIAFFLLKMNIDSFKIILKNTYESKTNICLLDAKLEVGQIIQVIDACAQWLEDREIREIYSKHINLITSDDLLGLLKKLEAFETDPTFDKNNTDWLLNHLLLGTFGEKK